MPHHGHEPADHERGGVVVHDGEGAERPDGTARDG
jgi:hypothetical protein